MSVSAGLHGGRGAQERSSDAAGIASHQIGRASATATVSLDRRTQRLYRIGFWSLVMLALVLPFEWTQRPLAVTGFTTFTNLMLAAYVVAALAAVSLASELVRFVREAVPGSREQVGYIYRRRVPVALFVALLACNLVSSLLTTDPGAGLKWTFHLLLGGLIWLAVPLWLSENRDARIKGLALALVAGAAVSATVGIVEVVAGPSFARHLSWFKAAPTAIGPYLRLSGTFEYANIAALYFELVLPFAVLGLLFARGRARGSAEPVLAWLVAADIIFLGVLLTYCRGAVLGLTVGTAAAIAAVSARRLWPAVRRQRARFAAVAGSFALAAGLGILLSPSLPVLRLTSSSDQQWYRATYTGRLPATVATAAFIAMPVKVANPGPLTWSTSGAHPYRLSYHWLTPSGAVPVFDGVRSTLPTDVAPGRSVTVEATVQTPNTPGSYRFVWDMVQEGVTWFSLKSASYVSQTVRVVGPPLPGAGGRPSAGTPPSLPISPVAPGRRALWAAALRMVAAHPLFGVGPDRFRLSYGAYLKPSVKAWDQRILANSLPLEMFADLGILGGAAFFALLAAIVWPLILSVWRRRNAVWWRIALIGSLAAFLGHGLVDYMLFSNAIFFLFWLLCGLAGAVELRAIDRKTEPAGLRLPSWRQRMP